MRRKGEISPSLWSFQTAYHMSKALEEYKPRTRKGAKSSRLRALAVCKRCDEVIGDAWERIERISETSGPEAADIVAAHYLFCEDWHTVSAERGIPYDLCKKLAYEAIKALDGDAHG